MAKLRVRLKSAWTQQIETESAVFIRDLPLAEADALLSEWAPDAELFTFPGRRAWYCCEPECQFRSMENGAWLTARARLGVHEFLWHGHPDRKFRVPHQTHFEELRANGNLQRQRRAIAIVSNHGGNPLFAHPDLLYRNRLITGPQVDLFGRQGWRRYRRAWYSWPRCPANYRGELPGDWHGMQKRQLMSTYKVCVCLENMNEPGYFTEKFVEAVLAGCIPVYRASADIRDSVLQGACWFDPGDARWPDEQAVQAALDADPQQCLRQNHDWLQSSVALRQTNGSAVFERIAQALRDRP